MIGKTTFHKKNYGLNDIRIFREKDIEWVILYLETYPSSDIIFEINAMPFVEKAILIH